MRTKWLPMPTSGRQAYMDGARLGAVLANVIGLPSFVVILLVTGGSWAWVGVVVFGCWVFALTIWARYYHFALEIRYLRPEGEEP